MADRFDTCLAFTLEAEGGYIDIPQTPAEPPIWDNAGDICQWSDDRAWAADRTLCDPEPGQLPRRPILGPVMAA